MNYINTETLEFPITELEIRQAFPNVMFPETFIAPDPFQPVTIAEMPNVLISQKAVQQQIPSLVGDDWILDWDIVELDQAEAEVILEAARHEIREVIKATRNICIQSGVRINKVIDNNDGTFTNFDKWFHTDVFSRTQMTALYVMGENVPANIMWKTMDGTFVEISQLLVAQIFNAIAARDTAVFSYAESLIAQVNASADPASVNIATGWPPSFS